MAEEDMVKTACYLCLSKCGLNVHAKDGKIVKVEGMPEHPVSHDTFALRLRQPLSMNIPPGA
jgi:anaerobic selenocysteine-containing dehydrogenase